MRTRSRNGSAHRRAASCWTLRTPRPSPRRADVGEVDNLVITAVERAINTVRDFDIAQAVRSVTVKLVGYTEVMKDFRGKR